MQLEVGRPTSTRHSEAVRGWVLLFPDRFEIHSSPPGRLAVRPDGLRSIAIGEVAEVTRQRETFASFARLVIGLNDGELLEFTLVPRNGSGLRGPTDDEIDSAIAAIEGQRNR